MLSTLSSVHHSPAITTSLRERSLKEETMNRLTFISTFAGLVGVGILGIAHAEQTVCPIVQTCPLKNCPDFHTDDNGFKEAMYTEGCKAFALEQGLKFVRYMPQQIPHCLNLMTIDGKFDCNLLK
jgi:hypothetical protein